VPRIVVAANRVRTAPEQEAIAQHCRKHALELFAVIPYGEAIPAAEQQGLAPIDGAPHSPAVDAMRTLATTLFSRLA
jgi:nitrogenase subunit NifH